MFLTQDYRSTLQRKNVVENTLSAIVISRHDIDVLECVCENSFRIANRAYGPRKMKSKGDVSNRSHLLSKYCIGIFTLSGYLL